MQKTEVYLTIYFQKNIPLIDVNKMKHTFTPLVNTDIQTRYDDFREDRASRRELRRVAMLVREEIERDITLGNLVLED